VITGTASAIPCRQQLADDAIAEHAPMGVGAPVGLPSFFGQSAQAICQVDHRAFEAHLPRQGLDDHSG